MTLLKMAVAIVNAGDANWGLGVKEYATFADDLVLNEEFHRLSHVAERFMLKVRYLLADQKILNDMVLLQYRQ